VASKFSINTVEVLMSDWRHTGIVMHPIA